MTSKSSFLFIFFSIFTLDNIAFIFLGFNSLTVNVSLLLLICVPQGKIVQYPG